MPYRHPAHNDVLDILQTSAAKVTQEKLKKQNKKERFETNWFDCRMIKFV